MNQDLCHTRTATHIRAPTRAHIHPHTHTPTDPHGHTQTHTSFKHTAPVHTHETLVHRHAFTLTHGHSHLHTHACTDSCLHAHIFASSQGPLAMLSDPTRLTPRISSQRVEEPGESDISQASDLLRELFLLQPPGSVSGVRRGRHSQQPFPFGGGGGLLASGCFVVVV